MGTRPRAERGKQRSGERGERVAGKTVLLDFSEITTSFDSLLNFMYNLLFHTLKYTAGRLFLLKIHNTRHYYKMAYSVYGFESL